jgi:hypothetical protein
MSMIERLQRALEHIEELSPAAQEDLAQFIEEMTEPIAEVGTPHQAPSDDNLPPTVRAALALGGAWRDLQDDDEFAYFERIRRESKPSPPIEDQLAWLDEEDAK